MKKQKNKKTKKREARSEAPKSSPRRKDKTSRRWMASRGGQTEGRTLREKERLLRSARKAKKRTKQTNKRKKKKKTKTKEKNRRVILTCTLIPASTVAVR